MSETLQLSANVEITAREAKTPRVSILAYSGGIMKPPGWPELVIDLAGLDTTKQVSLLADHKSDLADIVGHGSAAVRDGKLYVEGSLLPSSPASQQIIDHAKAGFEFEASVGVEPIERRHIAAGETIHVNGQTITAPAAGLLLIVAGILRETSIVAIGADRSSSVSIAAKGASTMTTTTTPETTEKSAPKPTELERIQARWEATNYKEDGPRDRANTAMLACAAGTITYCRLQ